MDKQPLDELLKQLQAELKETSADDTERRQTLRQMEKEVQAAIDRSEANQAQHYQSLRKQLETALAQFEVSHPKLALAITQVINGLVDIGA